MYLFNGICCHEEIPDKLKKYSQQWIVAKKHKQQQQHINITELLLELV